MNALFTINFRREAYQREVARARRRVLLLGAWVTYFGVLTVVLGLYGLNCTSLVRRTAQLERQVARARAIQRADDWNVGPAELATAEQVHASPRRWFEKLVRLAELLPPNAVVQSVAVNPDNLQSARDERRLVITGTVRVPAGQDRMRGVVQLVSALHADSVFAADYENIRLVSSRAAAGNGPVAEFEIECR